MILNMTQHPATSDQLAAGVVDLPTPAEVAKLRELLTFDDVPTPELVRCRAAEIAYIATNPRFREDGTRPAAMIGGALWLMAPLARELRGWGIRPLFAFSAREVVDEMLPDGSVRKTAIFRHKGFVPAVE